MAKLIVEADGSQNEEYPLDKDCITIGRKPDNDIQINSLAVSAHHAQVITILNDSFLEDLNSTNGTYVNSNLVNKQALRNGDVISIGDHQIKYINELSSDTSVNSNFEKTMVLDMPYGGLSNQDMNRQNTHSADSADIPSPSSTKTPSQGSNSSKAKLQILNGKNTGKELLLTKNLTTLGKPGIAVAAITRRPQGYFIIHVEGKKEHLLSRVNGQPIGVQAHPLHDNDVIEVGGIKMEFYMG